MKLVGPASNGKQAISRPYVTVGEQYWCAELRQLSNYYTPTLGKSV